MDENRTWVTLISDMGYTDLAYAWGCSPKTCPYGKDNGLGGYLHVQAYGVTQKKSSQNRLRQKQKAPTPKRWEAWRLFFNRAIFKNIAIEKKILEKESPPLGVGEICCSAM